MAGAAGHRAFIEQNRALLDATVVAIHLEHVACAVVEEGNGQLSPSSDPEVRWWFVSHNATLERLAKDAIVAHDLRRSLIFEPSAWPPRSKHPPSDGAFFYPDVPVIQHLAAPVFLFDSIDSPALVHRESLLPITHAVTAIVEGLRDETAASIRAGTTTPPEAFTRPTSP